ncbi:MAG: glycerol kinase GlpK [Alphaproteobacteria bacterium]
MGDVPHILAIDQGTTSTRALVFDRSGRPVAAAVEELGQIFPKPGWVEHDPEEIWRATRAVCRKVLDECEDAGHRVEAIGITNQRETTVVWDRATGKPIHNAIVWQDRRTADHCRRLIDEGREELVTERTGLVIDPYFSASKLAWLLAEVPGARVRAEAGELAFGTIDSFLLWRLTGGRRHATDATNASRTMLFDIRAQAWDPDLMDLFDVPARMMPEVLDSAAPFGETDPELFGRTLPVGGIAGDQQAATVGQACFTPGMVKSTYGTGCFAVLNTGAELVPSRNRMLTTIAYRLDGETAYALEGSIFVAGAAMQWLRDGLKVIASAPESEALARGLDGNKGVYMVPAFVGLGAPHWDPDARGAIVGMTLDTGVAEIVRAALEAVCYQTRDLIGAMTGDMGAPPNALRVDGGMVMNDWLVQFLADILDLPVERPAVTETTALGAAYLAGLETGIYDSVEEIARQWRRETLFEPAMNEATRRQLLGGWEKAISRVRG